MKTVLVPIYRKDEERAQVLEAAHRIAKDVGAKVDDREGQSPGAKFFHWERRGVPVVLELGAANEDRNVAALAACLGGMRKTTWDFAWPIMEANPPLAEKVLVRIANRIDYDRNKYLPLLTEKQLADLYLKVHGFFPPETDPDFSRGGFVTPRQSVVHFRGDIIGTLEARGTEEACCDNSTVGKCFATGGFVAALAILQRPDEQAT